MPPRFDSLRLDLSLALRPLRRAPFHAAAVAATFALGVGANATMFGIVDRLVVGRIDLRSVGLDSASSEAYFRDAVARVRSIPGVESALVAEAPPLSGWSMGSSLRVPGRDSLPQLDPDTDKHAVPRGTSRRSEPASSAAASSPPATGTRARSRW